MTELTKSITFLNEYKSLKEAVQQGKTPLLAVGLSVIHKAHLAAALGLDLNRPVCVLTDDDAAAARFSRDLQAFAEREVLTLPARELVMADVVGVSRGYEQKRLAVLGRAGGGKAVEKQRGKDIYRPPERDFSPWRQRRKSFFLIRPHSRFPFRQSPLSHRRF